jgi:hypothetical protein
MSFARRTFPAPVAAGNLRRQTYTGQCGHSGARRGKHPPNGRRPRNVCTSVEGAARGSRVSAGNGDQSSRRWPMVGVSGSCAALPTGADRRCAHWETGAEGSHTERLGGRGRSSTARHAAGIDRTPRPLRSSHRSVSSCAPRTSAISSGCSSISRLHVHLAPARRGWSLPDRPPAGRPPNHRLRGLIPARPPRSLPDGQRLPQFRPPVPRQRSSAPAPRALLGQRYSVYVGADRLPRARPPAPDSRVLPRSARARSIARLGLVALDRFALTSLLGLSRGLGLPVGCPRSPAGPPSGLVRQRRCPSLARSRLRGGWGSVLGTSD